MGLILFCSVGLEDDPLELLTDWRTNAIRLVRRLCAEDTHARARAQ